MSLIKTSKERLAFFLPGLYEGGAERVFLNLAQGISDRGYSVDLILARAEGPYLVQVPNSVRVIDLKAPRVVGSVPALLKYFNQENPTAILSALFTNIIALWTKRLWGGASRLVISEHNPLSSVVKFKKDIRWQLYPFIARRTYPWADHIIAVSQDVANDLNKVVGIPEDHIEIVYNPIITPDLIIKSKEPLEHPWFKAGEPPVLIAVGRLTDQKAFDTLINSFSIIRKKCSARLMILGEGENRSSLETLINQLGLEQDVQLMGFVQNPYPYMKHASLFVLPSRWEGLPTVLVEALFLGVPIVATDCPGGSREILRDGLYGKLVPVDKPLLLAEAIGQSLDVCHLCPPKESWTPFTLDTIVDHYLSLMLGIR